MLKLLTAWYEQAAKVEARETTKKEYDKWRYNYPKFDTSQPWTKVPSQEMSDCLVDELKKSSTG